jgi:hypothetical protein
MPRSKPPATPLDADIPALAARSQHKVLAAWAADCAEHALPIFEKFFANDARPRSAIAAARAWLRGDLSVSAARKAAFTAHAAARKWARNGEAQAAARAAGHAAATAHVAAHALHAANYAATAVYQAAIPANADAAFAAEREWQLQRLRQLEAK